ncbi:MAG: CAP domain-containing protein, partial [Thermomicrobiaceae bacterium]|nr:CAP domain-containing protein [Thermomicrobiaceae bacterium]
ADTALALINRYRSWLGLPPMRRSPALDAAASAHARYYQLNYGDPTLAGMGLHQEQPGKPGFTGETMQDRAEAQGYQGWVNENIGLSGSILTSLSWFIGTINHRLTLIDPRYTEIGFGAVNDGTAKIEVIDVGAPIWTDTASPTWVAWPPAATTGVGLSFSGEAPNPFPGATYPVGYPITLKYHGPGDVTFTSATLAAGGKSVPVLSATGAGWLTRRCLMLAATQPLAPGTVYTVTVKGSANGAPFSLSWAFRTRASGTEPLARDLPTGVARADVSVQTLWWLADGPVRAHTSSATWLWGPDTFASRAEPYDQSPGGQRQVYYFDKTRMEITHPDGDRSSAWFVTNGLLVRDMILGAVQVGDDRFVPARPAEIPFAGDPASVNPNAPTYASLSGLASLHDDRRAPNRVGQPVRETLSKSGVVGTDASLGGYTTLGAYDDVTGHNVAAIFWTWMTGQGYSWLYVVGHPIAEPYWVRT